MSNIEIRKETMDLAVLIVGDLIENQVLNEEILKAAAANPEGSMAGKLISALVKYGCDTYRQILNAKKVTPVSTDVDLDHLVVNVVARDAALCAEMRLAMSVAVSNVMVGKGYINQRSMHHTYDGLESYAERTRTPVAAIEDAAKSEIRVIAKRHHVEAGI